MRQIPLRIGPGPAPTFDNYAPGANAAALALLRARPLPPCLYLWGPAGAGKTHLLRALAAASAGPVLDGALAWEDGVALVLLDDCDGYDAARQQAAFRLYVEAATAGVPVVAAGRQPPVDLPLREDLRTRLGAGPVFALQPLSDDETAAVLKREAARRGIALADEVLAYLLSRYARDLGSLMGLLDALDDFSLAEKRTVTVPLLKKMLAEQAAHDLTS
jgi:DnaA family protein